MSLAAFLELLLAGIWASLFCWVFPESDWRVHFVMFLLYVLNEHRQAAIERKLNR